MAIMRKGRLMHVEDMHARRGLRMLLLRFDERHEPNFPDELELTVRERKQGTVLLEHRGDLSRLLAVARDDPRSRHRDRHRGSSQPLRQFHGTNVPDEEVAV